MAQWLKALGVLSENLGLVLSFPVEAHSHVLIPSSSPLEHCIHVVHRCSGRQNTHTHENK